MTCMEMATYFFHCLLVNEGPLLAGLVKRVPLDEASYLRHKSLDKPVVDTGLNKNAVGADTSLTAVAILGGDGSSDGLVHVS